MQNKRVEVEIAVPDYDAVSAQLEGLIHLCTKLDQVIVKTICDMDALIDRKKKLNTKGTKRK